MLQSSKKSARALFRSLARRVRDGAQSSFRSLLAAIGLQRVRDHALLIGLTKQRSLFEHKDNLLLAEKDRIIAAKADEIVGLKNEINSLLGLDHGFVGRDLWATTEADVTSFINKMLRAGEFKKSLLEIYSANQAARDAWIRKKVQQIATGSKVLDVGAGPAPYRDLFLNCEFKTHDFMQYNGYKSGTEGKYAAIDYVSDVTAIPVEDASFDVILCTEVLEHVPDPSAALKEMARIVRPGGKLLITAPLGSGLHQRPFHFYGGVTPDWYCHFASRYSLDVIEISANGGLFKLIAELCTVVASHIDNHASAHGEYKKVISVLFGAVLPRYLTNLDDKIKFDQYTIGYHVELRKKS
jgi:SAM-dependent methyltransferase